MDIRDLKIKEKKQKGDLRAIVTKATEEKRNVSDDESYESLLAELEATRSAIEALEAIGEEEIGETTEERVMTKSGAKVTNNPEDREWGSLGEQLRAVANYASPHNPVLDPRLKRSQGLNESVPSEGGFLVDQQFQSGLIKKAHETGILTAKTRKIPIGAGKNGIKMNTIDETSRATGSRMGGIQAYWLNEGGEKTKSKPKFGKLSMDLEKLIGLLYATDELMEDTVALQSVFEQGFAEEFGFMVDDAIIRGTGAGTPQGILNSSALISVAKETGQAADTIVSGNIIKMYSRMWARSIPRASWFINQECLPQLMKLKIDIGTGGQLLYMPANGLSESPYGTLFGRPVIPLEQSSALGDKGDIIFADFNEYLLIDKGAPKSDTSIHVRFIYDEMAFRVVYRVNGQSVWKSALTPYKGSNTISPFITLAERA